MQAQQLCPHCLDPTGTLAKATAGEAAAHEWPHIQAQSRMRRSRRKRRTKNRVGLWWKKFGYAGPVYCQRCSEVFRDHILRGNSNSADCTLTTPCHDCRKVLRHCDLATLERRIQQTSAYRYGVSSHTQVNVDVSQTMPGGEVMAAKHTGSVQCQELVPAVRQPAPKQEGRSRDSERPPAARDTATVNHGRGASCYYIQVVPISHVAISTMGRLQLVGGPCPESSTSTRATAVTLSASSQAACRHPSMPAHSHGLHAEAHAFPTRGPPLPRPAVVGAAASRCAAPAYAGRQEHRTTHAVYPAHSQLGASQMQTTPLYPRTAQPRITPVTGTEGAQHLLAFASECTLDAVWF